MTNNRVKFTFMWPSIVTNFFVMKPTRCTNFINLFCHETLHVSDSLSIIRSLFTVHSTMVYVIQVCRQLSRRTRSCSKAVYKPLWCIPLLSLQWINSWWRTDELSETCRVSWQNKFVQLVHLVGFITKKTEWNFLKLKYLYFRQMKISIVQSNVQSAISSIIPTTFFIVISNFH